MVSSVPTTYSLYAVPVVIRVKDRHMLDLLETPSTRYVYSGGRIKVPKCENSDLMDSHDFYTIKPLSVGDFGTVKKKFKSFLFWL